MAFSFACDRHGHLAAMDAFDGATPVLRLAYTSDLAGNIDTINLAGDGHRGRDYAHGERHRLTRGKFPGTRYALQDSAVVDQVFFSPNAVPERSYVP